MNGDTVFVLLVVVGLGGLAVWLVTRKPDTATVPAPPKPGICATAVNVGIQAGGASQGVKTGDQSAASDLLCKLGNFVGDGLQMVPETVGRGVTMLPGTISSAFGFGNPQPPATCEKNGVQWGKVCPHVTPTASKEVPPPVTPQIVAARRTFVRGALT